MVSDCLSERESRGHLHDPECKKIALLDHLGGGNLGDDATLDAVMQNIRKRWPHAEIHGFSMNPSDTQTRHGIPAYPIRRQTWSIGHNADDNGNTGRHSVIAMIKAVLWKYLILKVITTLLIRIPRALVGEVAFLAKSFNTIRTFDILVISGGGQLLDSWGGPWKFPCTLLKWVLLARLSGVRCYFLNVGAGPLNHRLSRVLLKRALLLADYVSLRDEDSRSLVQQLGFMGKSHVFPDSVYSLEICQPIWGTHRDARPIAPLVGIAPMAYCDPRRYWHKDQNVYKTYIQTLSTFASQLLKDHFRIAVFSTDIYFDADAIHDLEEGLGKEQAIGVLHNDPSGVDDLLLRMSQMDYIVTCRFHGVIFGHLLRKPVLALSHHAKVSTLMKDFGVSEYCLDIDSVRPDALLETFQRLVKNRDEIANRVAEKVEECKVRLNTQFDELFGKRIPPLVVGNEGMSRCECGTDALRHF